MPRISEITKREQMAEADRHHFDGILASRKEIPVPYRYMLHSPAMATLMAQLMEYSRYDKQGFSAEVKELAICTVAREMNCLHEWGAHQRHARKAGLREEALVAIRTREAPKGLTESEAQVVVYVQQLLRPPHRVSEPVFSAMRERLGESQLMEFTIMVGSYVALACTFNAYEVLPGEGHPLLPT